MPEAAREQPRKVRYLWARYPGWCVVCGSQFDVGARIAWTPGSPAHADCGHPELVPPYKGPKATPPPPPPPRPQPAPASFSWQQTLGLGPGATLVEAKARYRQLARGAHPDHGGSTEAMQRLNDAMAAARRAFP